MVRRKFNLRGCRPLTPTEADYKHCLYGHLKFCTAPCVGNVTHEQYKEQVLAACDFLSGQCEEMESHLDTEMRKVALNQEYEKAAELRDTLASMRRTTAKTTRFERTPWNLPVSVMPERDNVELGKVLNLPAPPQRIEVGIARAHSVPCVLRMAGGTTFGIVDRTLPDAEANAFCPPAAGFHQVDHRLGSSRAGNVGVSIGLARHRPRGTAA